MILAIGDPAGDLKPAIVPAKVRLSFGSLAHQGLAEVPKAGLRMSGRDQSRDFGVLLGLVGTKRAGYPDPSALVM